MFFYRVHFYENIMYYRDIHCTLWYNEPSLIIIIHDSSNNHSNVVDPCLWRDHTIIIVMSTVGTIAHAHSRNCRHGGVTVVFTLSSASL